MPYKIISLGTYKLHHRRCPGLSVAESSLFISVTHILAVFKISHPVDEYGHAITEPAQFTDEHIA